MNGSLGNNNTFDEIHNFIIEKDNFVAAGSMHPLERWTGHEAHPKSQGWGMKRQLQIISEINFQPLSQNDAKFINQLGQT